MIKRSSHWVHLANYFVAESNYRKLKDSTQIINPSEAKLHWENEQIVYKETLTTTPPLISKFSKRKPLCCCPFHKSFMAMFSYCSLASKENLSRPKVNYFMSLKLKDEAIE